MKKKVKLKSNHQERSKPFEEITNSQMQSKTSFEDKGINKEAFTPNAGTVEASNLETEDILSNGNGGAYLVYSIGYHTTI